MKLNEQQILDSLIETLFPGSNYVAFFKSDRHKKTGWWITTDSGVKTPEFVAKDFRGAISYIVSSQVTQSVTPEKTTDLLQKIGLSQQDIRMINL